MGPPGALGRSQACSGESGRCGDPVLEEGEGRGLADEDRGRHSVNAAHDLGWDSISWYTVHV